MFCVSLPEDQFIGIQTKKQMALEFNTSKDKTIFSFKNINTIQKKKENRPQYRVLISLMMRREFPYFPFFFDKNNINNKK